MTTEKSNMQTTNYQLKRTDGSNLYLVKIDIKFKDARDNVKKGEAVKVAILRWVDLSGVDLRGVDLKGAILRWAILKGTDLRGTDLRGVNLRGGDLRGANMTEADLRRTDLRWADLRWVNLRGAKYNDKTLFPVGFDPKIRQMIEEQ